MNVVALLPYLVEHYDEPSSVCIDAAVSVADVSHSHTLMPLLFLCWWNVVMLMMIIILMSLLSCLLRHCFSFPSAHSTLISSYFCSSTHTE